MQNMITNDFTSIGQLKESIERLIANIRLNNKDPYEIPVYVIEDYHKYPISSVSFAFGNDKYCGLCFYKSDEIKVVAPDSRPYIGGEYWTSRGPSELCCSGFVKSKLAGERLLRMVKYVLETDEPKSWLDFREREPEWIQFKFSSKEFDLEKLDKLSKENDGVLNEKILRECVKN